MQITTAAIFLFAAMGAVASPVDSDPNGIDARDVAITYDGTCTKATNTCRYKNQNGGYTLIKCPSFANKKCTNDGKKCTFDSANKKVTCD